jgi:Helicase HerA, central domain
MNSARAISLAQQIIREPDDYPTPVYQAAVMLLLDPESRSMQGLFLDVYDQASVVKNVLASAALPFPPDEDSYYEPGELLRPGVEIGVEPLGGWTLKLFPEQLRRHLVVVGMTGSGKTNLLRLIALGLGEIDK